MAKKDKKPRKKKYDTLIKAVSKAADVFKVISLGMTAAHPTTLGLIVMSGTTLGRIIAGVEDPTDARSLHVHGQLTGLYQGAQSIAVASAVVPVVSGSLNLIGQFLGTKAGAK